MQKITEQSRSFIVKNQNGDLLGFFNVSNEVTEEQLEILNKNPNLIQQTLSTSTVEKYVKKPSTNLFNV